MQIIEIQTLVDITDTKVARPKQGTALQHDQHRNFTTLKQCVEIRSIIDYDTGPQMEIKDIKGLGFGSDFKGKHAVWTFRFFPDREGVYVSDDGNVIGSLIEDVHSVPVIQKLTETINIEQAIFELHNPSTKNTIIKAL